MFLASLVHLIEETVEASPIYALDFSRNHLKHLNATLGRCYELASLHALDNQLSVRLCDLVSDSALPLLCRESNGESHYLRVLLLEGSLINRFDRRVVVFGVELIASVDFPRRWGRR